MQDRAAKRESIATSTLTSAAEYLSDSVQIEHYSASFQKHLSESNFELAMEALEAAGLGGECDLPKEFWHHLKKTAEILGDNEKIKLYREKRRNS